CRSSAMSAPLSTIWGARSPPIASRAIVIVALMGRALRAGDRRSRILRFLRCYFASVVVTARLTDVVRPLQFAAIRTFGVTWSAQRMVRAPHIAARGRDFLLRNGHVRLLLGGCAGELGT